MFSHSKQTVTASSDPLEKQFSEIESLIQQAKQKVFSTINSTLVDLYWRIGAYICQKVKSTEWGRSVVKQLALYLQEKMQDPKGFSDKNLWRMKLFYEEYQHDIKLSALLRELSWTNNLLILSKAKNQDERRFYIDLCIKQRMSSRTLEQQINTCLYERSVATKAKLSPVLKEMMPKAESIFKDSYNLAFLDLAKDHSEKDLRTRIVDDLKNFIIEFSCDFAFIGQEYRVQVGQSDFFLDLLFYHRELQCLVAIELKIDEFRPEYLGKMSFYLEALDRDIKKTHERPSVGVVLCKSKDDEVVEYSLSRTLSPAAVAEYQTKLPDKKLLQQKLHEWIEIEEC